MTHNRPKRTLTTMGTLRIVSLALIAMWTLVPIVLLVVLSFSNAWFYPALFPSVFSLENWTSFSGSGSSQRSALLTSVALALVTATGACVIALPFGRLIAKSTGWTRRLAAAVAFAPVAIPPISLATGLHVTLLTMGLGGHFWGVVIAHLIPTAGYLSLFFLGVFSSMDLRVEDEARTLGAAPATIWRRVLLPMLRRPVGDALAIGFLISWAQVPLTLLIGEGVVRTLPLDIFAAMRAGNDARAATGSLVLIVPALIALAVMRMAARQTRAVGL